MLTGLALLATSLKSFAIITDDNPCGSSAGLLSLINRPSAATSTCPVPDKNVIIESGIQYERLLGTGTQQNLPDTEIRFGLADYFEFSIITPNYIHQSVEPKAGFGTTSLTIKHMIAAEKQWAFSLDMITILPSGSRAFGSQKPGGVFSGILTYNLSSELSVVGMLGISTQSLAVNDGGQSFKSINPDVVLSWSKDRIGYYAELYGQSKTSPYDGSGYNWDAGITYLLRKNIEVDLEVGHRISGNLGGFTSYVGTGLAIQLS